MTPAAQVLAFESFLANGIELRLLLNETVPASIDAFQEPQPASGYKPRKLREWKVTAEEARHPTQRFVFDEFVGEVRGWALVSKSIIVKADLLTEPYLIRAAGDLIDVIEPVLTRK